VSEKLVWRREFGADRATRPDEGDLGSDYVKAMSCSGLGPCPGPGPCPGRSSTLLKKAGTPKTRGVRSVFVKRRLICILHNGMTVRDINIEKMMMAGITTKTNMNA